MEGYVKLHRKLLDWEWYNKPEMISLFLTFLLLANHQANKWQGQLIRRGQFITGRKSLKEKTGLSEQTIRTCIKRLKSTNEITIKSTSRNSLITIINWEQYQKRDNKLTSKLTSNLTNNQPAINQQLTTNKNDKNEKNDKNTKTLATPEVKREIDTKINHIMELFYKSINPGINFGNKTNRSAAEFLINKFGYDETIKMINQVISIHGKNYAPVVSTPYQLKEKLGDLIAYFKREKENNQPLIKVK